MSQKRGAIEVQFNWIFVFVAGALILALFVGFVNRQTDSAEKSLAGQIVRDMNTIMTQSAVTSDKYGVVTLVKPLEFHCDPDACNDFGCTSDFEVEGTGVTWQTPVQPIFAPDLVSGREMVTWSLDWSVPFRVTNFLFLTSKDVRYVFVGSTGDPIEDISKEMPDSVTKELVTDPANIPNQNHYKVKLIFYNTDPISNFPSNLAGMPDGDVSAINIISSDNKVQFYINDGGSFSPEGEAFYFGAASLYGAIFAEDKAMYECNMRKAMLRLKRIAEVYRSSVSNKKSASPPPSILCNDIYDKAMDTNPPGGELQQLTGIGYNNLANLVTISTASAGLENKNHQLKIYSCPVIY